MIQQVEITLQPKSRGFHLVTGEIMRQLPKLPKTGIINIIEICRNESIPSALSPYPCFVLLQERRSAWDGWRTP